MLAFGFLGKKSPGSTGISSVMNIGFNWCRAGTARQFADLWVSGTHHRDPKPEMRGHKMAQLVSALAIAIVLVFSGIAAAIAESIPPIPPLPDKYKGIKMVQPDPGVPKEIAAFL
jgi:hypothetical protein